MREDTGHPKWCEYIILLRYMSHLHSMLQTVFWHGGMENGLWASAHMLELSQYRTHLLTFLREAK